MIVCNTQAPPDCVISKTLGLIWVESFKGVNFARDIFANWRNILGGHVRGYEKELAAIKQDLVDKLVERAREIKATGVVNVSFDTEVITIKDGVILMMTATGTAVLIQRKDEG